MKAFHLISTVLLAVVLAAACGGASYDEYGEVYDEGLILNDDIVAERSNDGTLSFRNTATNKVTIKGTLGITPHPVCSIKSVWLRERPHEKQPPSKSGG